MESTDPIVWQIIIIQLLGGLAIFLFGMEMMTAALKAVAGSRMKDFLGKWTTNKFKGIGAGALVTAIIQSSSVTTVTVVGFVSAGLMTLPQAMGVIMGANIGTTITAHLIAFNVIQLALALAIVGFSLITFAKPKKLQQVGTTLMGLGLLFLGMELMGAAMEPLKEYPPFVQAMSHADNMLLAVLFGALFTALVQSSSATTGIVIAMAGQGLITLDLGIAIVLGANIGTSVTAILGSLGQSREAQQTAAFHVIFNTLGAIIWLPLIGVLAGLSYRLAPGDLARQVAWATTIFNVGNTLIFVWFTTPMAAFIRRIIPPKAIVEPASIKPKYLDERLLNTPALALDRVRLELGRLGMYTLRMAEKALSIATNSSEVDLLELAAMDEDVDALYAAIIAYLGKLGQEAIEDSELERQNFNFLTTANYLENIADIIETDLVTIGLQIRAQQLQMSAETAHRLQKLQGKVTEAVTHAVNALVEENPAQARSVLDARSGIKKRVRRTENYIAMRLTADEPNRATIYQLEYDAVDALNRMYRLARRIAKIVVKQEKQIQKAAA